MAAEAQHPDVKAAKCDILGLGGAPSFGSLAESKLGGNHTVGLSLTTSDDMPARPLGWMFAYGRG
jgi:hypothetical protein